MALTLMEFMKNPAGKGSSVLPQRELIISDLETRYDKILLSKKFDKKVYMVDDSYIYHIKVPSEDVKKNLYYDVLIEFYPIDKTSLSDTSIKNYGVKLFSNSPSFVYTYAYVYKKNGLLISGLENKFKSITLKSKPVVRNPNQVIFFEKTLYYGCLTILKDNFWMNKIRINLSAKKLKRIELNNKVKNSDTIELEYTKAKREKKENEKKELDAIKSINDKKQIKSNKLKSINKLSKKTSGSRISKLTKNSKMKKIQSKTKTYK